MNVQTSNIFSESQYRQAPQHRTEVHLTDDQFDDHLIGDLAPAAAAHLSVCTLCAGRAAQANTLFSDFNAVSLEWSERRSATAPMPAFSAQPVLWQRRLIWASAVACFAVGLGMTNATHTRFFTQQASTEPAATERAIAAPQTIHTAPPSMAQLAEDNRMLSAIDREMDNSGDSPAALGLEPVSAHATHSPASLLQD
jgi:hypothetical protein